MGFMVVICLESALKSTSFYVMISGSDFIDIVK